MKMLLEAVAHCHAQGIVHRDIRPDNVRLTENETARLLGFGKSKSQKSKDDAYVSKGLEYKAPECFKNTQGTPADMWSLGVMMYQLTYGSLPFNGKSEAELKKSIQAGKLTFKKNEFNEVSEDC